MTLRLFVMGLAAIAVLGYIWYRNRQEMQRHEPRQRSGRAVTDEAAQAFEDIADQIIGGSERLRRPAARPESRRRVTEDVSHQNPPEDNRVERRT